MGLRIIDNKRIEMTDDEWNLYEKICHSYDDINFKGEFLFKGLFETNNDGIIIFLRPPVTKTSFEVYLFLINLTVQQHLRLMHQQVDDVCNQINQKLSSLEDKLK